MQKRYWLKTVNTFEDAVHYKNSLLTDTPDRNIQIRKGSENGRQIFRVVERFQTNEAKVIQETKLKNKRRGKKVEDYTWVRS